MTGKAKFETLEIGWGFWLAGIYYTKESESTASNFETGETLGFMPGMIVSFEKAGS